MIVISPGGKKILNCLSVPAIYRCALIDFAIFQLAVETAYNPRFVPVVVR